MTHADLLEGLFRAHLVDLKSVAPEKGDVFVCPICTREFPIEAIYKEELTDGHVWPDYIREKSGSALASSQRVLLCKSCNSKAGSRGDKQMQLLEQVKDGEKTGVLYDERRIQIIQTLGKKPVDLRGKITRTGELSVRFTFSKDKKRNQWARNNPKEQGRFLSLAASDEVFTAIVHTAGGLHSTLAQTGWLTSAYLFAFYTFGYRYIFHDFLDPVRKHIFASFGNDNHLALPKSNVISVKSCETHNYGDPRLELNIPTNGEMPVHVEVSFLNYHVKLPFHGVTEVLMDVIRLQMPDFETRLPELAEQGASLRAVIVCTKLDGHSCMWDYVLGKEIPTS